MTQPSVLTRHQAAVNPFWQLTSSIGAIQLANPQTEGRRAGTFTKLPVAAVVTLVGPGFSDETVLVECSGLTYVVFRQDLKPAGTASI